MIDDVFKMLGERLDELSVGFPATESGVELRILQKLFTKKEAEIVLQMGMALEEPKVIADRTGNDLEKVEALLQHMADKGLIFRLKRNDSLMYGALPFAVGFYEFQVRRMDREFAELFERYWEEASHKAFILAGSILRPIPVYRSLDPRLPVSTHENCRDIVRSQEFITVADCICRAQKGFLKTACDKPLEVCLIFGSHGQAYMDLGISRRIEVEEALAILDKAEATGLVPQPANLQNPTSICNCCGDCCGVLRSLNLLPKPAEAVLSNFFAAIDPETCTGCEVCLERCQMNAVSVDENSAASINLDRCIGCGLCVTTCPVEAIRLEAKSEEKRRTPPKNGMEMLANIASQRGVPLAKVIRGRE